jgi:hypothetical protein
MSLVTGLFFLVILLNQEWSPPLRLQASHCSIFRVIIIIIIIIIIITRVGHFDRVFIRPQNWDDKTLGNW